ncbi:Unknown protein sequence [Pseudomonas savastanoi pv. glycinea]|uniref:Uncharacterized protein n=1 Tax=Pseudomonas savastanoi pv. glycinea TaxID=318 RepID=A0ABR5LF74_PSESG|nr:Unknown protein sequence [Pseudomonas savastanoi pv. glycinea]KPC45432.1 Unknown protein sequence [Pseudomonas savastanoi pv. glycinea]
MIAGRGHFDCRSLQVLVNLVVSSMLIWQTHAETINES